MPVAEAGGHAACWRHLRPGRPKQRDSFRSTGPSDTMKSLDFKPLESFEPASNLIRVPFQLSGGERIVSGERQVSPLPWPYWEMVVAMAALGSLPLDSRLHAYKLRPDVRFLLPNQLLFLISLSSSLILLSS